MESRAGFFRGSTANRLSKHRRLKNRHCGLEGSVPPKSPSNRPVSRNKDPEICGGGYVTWRIIPVRGLTN